MSAKKITVHAVRRRIVLPNGLALDVGPNRVDAKLLDDPRVAPFFRSGELTLDAPSATLKNVSGRRVDAGPYSIGPGSEFVVSHAEAIANALVRREIEEGRLRLEKICVPKE